MSLIFEWAFLCLFIVYKTLAIPNPLQVGPPLCDKDLFGRPKLEDCYQAMFWIPFINPPGNDSPDARAIRIFAEPQYLDPPFKAVKNPLSPKAIVQLPKIWKHGTFLSVQKWAGDFSKSHSALFQAFTSH